jgi:hypothetical protein
VADVTDIAEPQPTRVELRTAEAAYVLGRCDRQIRRLADAGVLTSRRLTARSPRTFPVAGIVALLCRREIG